MRSSMRVLTGVCAVALLSLPLLMEAGSAPAAQPHGLTVPAQVSASNWSVVPNAVSTAPTPFTGQLSCVTAVFCMKVGGPLILVPSYQAQTWNGTTWGPLLTLPTVTGATGTPSLADVSCVTTSFCVAVGVAPFAGGNSPLIEQWNGTSWSVVLVNASTTTNTLLTGVSCLSVSWCMAGGVGPSGPITEQWNGSSWTMTSLPLPTGATAATPLGVSCGAPTSCMLVGVMTVSSSSQPLAEFWNGSGWTSTTVPLVSGSTGYFTAISCAGLTFCAAVGANAQGGNQINLAETWSGSAWNPFATPSPATSNNALYGLSCFSATSCVAVGSAPNSGATATVSQALTYDGQSWHLVAPPNPAGANPTILSGISCLTDWACMASGLTVTGSVIKTYDLMAPIARSGYRFVASDGGIFNYGSGAPFLGSLGATALNAPIVGMATMPAGDGYYLVASDGGVFNYGSAVFYGSMGGKPLNKPIVGIAVTPSGGGYWLVASDGGIFSFGDAVFYGSMGGQPLNKPIVGIASTPNGNGYYLVASDGGIFTFPTQGGPPFLGSTGAITLNKPVVGMAVTPAGQYYLVASDGGIFSFPSNPSGPPFFGSTGGTTLNKPVIGMSIANGGTGYYLGAADGGIFSFPTGPSGPVFFGSRGGQPLNKPIVGISG
jgi:hypothetical protein